MSNKDNEQYLSRRDFLKAAGIVTGSALLTACGTDGLTLEPTAIPLVESSPQPLSKAILSEVPPGQRRDALLSSLPENKPEPANGEASIKFYNFKAGEIDIPVALWDLTPEEIENSLTIIPTAEMAALGVAPTVQSVALYTPRVDLENESTWERLAAITIPRKDEEGVTHSVEIKWFANPGGFPKEGDIVNPSRVVLYYVVPQSAGDPEFVVRPLISNPTVIPGWDGGFLVVDYGAEIPQDFYVDTKLNVKEEEKFVPVVESINCMRSEDCVEGSMEIGPGGKEFYKYGIIGAILNGSKEKYVENYIPSKAMEPNEEFIKYIEANFGMTPYDSKGKLVGYDLETFMTRLSSEEQEYLVPQGLPILLPDPEPAHLKVQYAPEFYWDFVAVEFLTPEKFVEKTLSRWENGEKIEAEWKNSEIFSADVAMKGSGYAWGITFDNNFPDGKTRMRLMVAATSDLPSVELGQGDLVLDLKSPEAAPHWEQMLKFITFTFQNTGRQIDDLRGGRYLNVETMFNQLYDPQVSDPKWVGEYDRKAESNESIIVPRHQSTNIQN